jgi:hypothetical protein
LLAGNWYLIEIQVITLIQQGPNISPRTTLIPFRKLWK